MERSGNEFQGFFAEFFDMLHQGCDDADIYPEMLKPYGKDILEVGSGTGRIAVPLARAGYRVTGIECEKDMIALMEKKDYPRANLRVVREDARRFRLDEKFDAVLLSCNFINHFPEAEDVVSVLRRCAEHLKKDGRVIVDCSAPDTRAMVSCDGGEETLTFKTGNGGEIRDFFRARYDLLNQIEEDEIRLEEWRDGVPVREARTVERLTWYYPREIRSMIREAGLRVVWESGRLSPSGPAEPIGKDAEEMVFCCALA